MIKISDLSKNYGSQSLLDRVSFNINQGERIGLVGRNGSGKTTMFRMLLGIEEPDSGEIGIPKDYTMGYLQQHLLFTQPTILEEAGVGLPQGKEYDHWRVEKILFGLGFTPSDMSRAPQELSGGFQIRLNLSKTLVSEPDLLLLDEPTNYLDIVSIRWLKKFLRTWKREFILITHDRQFMDSVTTHTIGIHRRKIKKIQGSTSKLYQQIMLEEEIYEKTRLHDEKRQKELEIFIRRFRAKARLAGLVQSRIKTLEKQQKLERLEKFDDVEFQFSFQPFPAQEMLSTKDLGFNYTPSSPWLIDKLNFSLGRHERIAVIGKNGKGKSTLLQLLAKELDPLEGMIKQHSCLKIGYFGQTNIQRLNPEYTVEQEMMAAEPHQSRERSRNVCGAMLFSGDQALKKVSVLSGGEKSRVLLGKLLLHPANLLLLDEPTNHLDMESCSSLLDAMQNFPGSIMFVTHDEIFLHTLAEKLIIFDRDHVIFYPGKYRDFLHDIGWENEETQKEDFSKAGLSQSPKPETESKVAKSNNAAKKKLRQARAKIIQEKSRVLRPLEAKVKELEEMIEQLELEMSQNDQHLIEASIQGDVQSIADLPKKRHEIQTQVDFLYVKLEKIHHEYELKVKQFEKN